ncbi:FAD-binding protein [Necropsobacter massiliensis]|uniref:FAD-binding protein n=1 Tax=Necropsobacter massiliensis TaxID=1400001 RepID=UPI000595B89C|nr:FAD-binding protein [Necropsobacter massiliensis]
MHKINVNQFIETDVLIIGGGIAGLACCVEAGRQHLRSILVCKTVIGGGASYFPLKATLGVQVSGGKEDEVRFQEEINRVGHGLSDPHIVRAYIEESAQSIELLNRIGFRPRKRSDNRPACFARYSRPIYLIDQWRDAAARAQRIIANQTNTEQYEHTTLLHIVCQHNQVQGAILGQQKCGRIFYIFCRTRNIILASGGIAGLYQDNLYPADIIGSAHYIAKQAGASLVNLEFIQFIPSFTEPKYKVLFGEHTLKYVTSVTDRRGRNLFAHLHPQQFRAMMNARSDYAPFSMDFPGVEFDLSMMRHLLAHPEEKGVYLHYSPALYQDKTEFYQVYLQWLEREVGINLCRDNIAIRPFAHSCNGGIKINQYAQSEVNGLFAVGEAASCIEGANRLGGNSVGGSLVFAKRAVQKIKQNQALNIVESTVNVAEQIQAYFAALDNPNGNPALSASTVLATIRENMTRFANVYRTQSNLALLATTLEELEKHYCPLHYADSQGIDIYNALKTAQEVVRQMRCRTLSLGAHQIATNC